MMILLLITCLDGSQVSLKVKDDVVFDVQTKYGVLKVPVKDVRDINVGIHVDNPAPYLDAVKSLGKEAYKNRDAATKFLKNNPRGGWKYIKEMKDDPDLEVKKRIKLILDSYKDFPPLEDRVAVSSGYFSGMIQQDAIEGVSDSLGTVKIKISEIKLIEIHEPGKDIELDSGTEEWQEVGYVHGGKLTITATGTIDLFPTQPGQYMVGPKGYTQNGKGGMYLAGTIIGRDCHGKEFLVGASYSTVSFPRGKLELRVVPSTWNQLPSGLYKIKIE